MIIHSSYLYWLTSMAHPAVFSGSYVEYPPPEDLARWVACFWWIDGEVADGTALAHRVLPDGCADLVFAFGSTTLVGPMNSALVVELRGRVDVMGIRFRPGVIGAFAAIPANHLLDAVIPCAELPFTLEASDEELCAAQGEARRLMILKNICRARVAALPPPDTLIRHVLDGWSPYARAGFARVSAISAAFMLSERAFERRFTRSVGMTPVRYRRLARFRRSLALYGNGRHDWAVVADAAGYSDQSHLVRDFRAFAGVNPSEWAMTQASHAGFVQDAGVTTA